MQPLTRLARIAASLAKVDEDRAKLMRKRDDLIREARDAGETWVSIQDATGLSPRAVALALRRSEAESQSGL